jgi:hypothetical protein
MSPEKEKVKKEGAWSALGESIFGIRWAKSGRAKILWGCAFLLLCPVIILDPDLRNDNEGILLLILFLAGVWLIYKGVKQKNTKT